MSMWKRPWILPMSGGWASKRPRTPPIWTEIGQRKSAWERHSFPCFMGLKKADLNHLEFGFDF